MRLKTIVSPTVSRALEQVNLELGPHALILETEQEGELTRVVAADVEREEPIEGLMRLRAEIALLRRELQQQNEILRALVVRTREGAFAPSPPSVVAPATLKAAPSIVAPSIAAPSIAGPPSATIVRSAPAVHASSNAEVLASRARFTFLERRLREQGVRGDLIERVLTLCVDAPASEGDPLQPTKSEWCVTALAGVMPGIGPAGNRKARCFVFVGPPGCGKSTMLAKLLQQSKSPDHAGLAVISLDDRAGSNVLLQRTTQRLRVRHAVARGAEDLIRAIKDLDEPKTLLIDTAGYSNRERRAIAALRERMPQAGQVVVHLVLGGDKDDASTVASARTFADASPSALLLTRLDLATRFGGIVNASASLSLPVAALGHGAALAGDLTVPNRRQVAEIVLGRRMLGRR